MITPLPSNIGYGFFSLEAIPNTYKVEKVGRYWNYYFTTDNWHWPIPNNSPNYTIDAFSPNLNKTLHVGHLRQLTLASALFHSLPNSNFVALLGASLGIDEQHKADLMDWFDFVDYHPKIYFDISLPGNLPEGTYSVFSGDYKGCQVWNGPKGPVVLIRSNEKKTYAYYDLIFSQIANPSHYITGEEQKNHFASLGFSAKHLAMGLVLGKDGKKIKSREGAAPSAIEIIQLIMDKLQQTEFPKKLAWNILAWNFLRCNREKSVMFDPDKWTHPDSGGMYISYTYARILSALKEYELAKPNIESIDLPLLAFSEYYHHWYNRMVDKLDPAPLANYAYDLANLLGKAYHQEKIINGRKSFRFAVHYAFQTLSLCMQNLGMFLIEHI